MTASIHELGKGRAAGSYYTSDPNREARPHRRDEYYFASDKQELTLSDGAGGGVWWSTGETIVVHDAPVDGEVFRDLCAGLDPRTGDRPGTAKGLVRGAGEAHRAGWDITFSAPKSVSLLWAAGNEDQRAVIRAAHRQAVEAALLFMESEELLVVRLGAGGGRRERPTDLMIARFDHFTSREGDPNLHSHCVIMNVAGSADGKYRTIEPRVLYDWQKTVGSAYRMHLSEHLHQQGMVAREAGRGQFEVAGIEQVLLDRFSKRSAQIEELVGDRADVTGRRKEIANLATRKGKDQVPTGEALETRWLEEFGPDRDQLWAQAILVDRTYRPSASLHQSLDLATAEDFPTVSEVKGRGPVARGASALLRHEIVINRRSVLERSFALASLQGIGAAAVAAELAVLEANHGLLRLTKEASRDTVWTTPELKRIEADMLKAARRPDERIWLEADAIETALQSAPHLSEEQIEAVRAAGSPNGVGLLQAGAGTGKTTTMQPIVRAAELSGLRVIGLAPSWVAADELRKSTGIPAVAIAKWRYDLDRGGAMPIDSRTILIVDEASMVGTRDLSTILTVVRDAGAKVLLVGDKRQLEAVGPGAPLRIVADVLEQEATLLQVRRQQVAWQREASIAMAQGDVATGVQAYLDHGAAEAADGREATLARSVEAWMELRSRHGDDTLMITRRNKDVADLNRKARAVLRSQGRLADEEVSLSSIDREGKVVALSVAIGDRLRFGQSHPTLGLRNGTLLVVENVRLTLNDVVVRFRAPDGSKIETAWQDLAPSYKGRVRPPRVTHAYASTIHSAQGRTVSASVYTAIMEPDARELYVALTRHAQDAKIVVAKALEGGTLSIQRHPEAEIGIRQNPEPATPWKANIIDFE